MRIINIFIFVLINSFGALLNPSKMAQTENIIVCNSVAEFNERLSNARPKNSVVIAGMYNSLVDRILIGDSKNQGKVKEMFRLR